MPRVLLTGFEPFGGGKQNVSAEVVTRFAHKVVPGLEVHTQIFPVDIAIAPQYLIDRLISLVPDWCIMLGEASGRTAITLERVAINLCDFRIADNGGHQPRDEQVIPDAQDAYFTTLPVRDLLNSIQATGVQSELSLSAGSYLCNAVFYTALHYSSVYNLPTRCGFIHLPNLETLALVESYTGIYAALETLALEKTAKPVATPRHSGTNKPTQQAPAYW
ncbi:MAG: pyroglutamyl-peptidase I [Chloroflexi bacterium AL-W]|nr:pyroglutamyl-peptidase I [Chloroflexi bacterium AL-N1]NOK69695.1 pyroglutamyl-peptidase I [Chloroflexi bacterium AL-N10]NOK72242.1 pyroglutamyl-peptidase I [Chloroflexi bacterium AL-N5]NOK85071.1 pyroglutamyl-peptidase I [Chloroflexi bacterium AL-W]NOK91824.1 pyroglutamyl-peptidase I [Chloroflexi bacterium AL-N15]